MVSGTVSPARRAAVGGRIPEITVTPKPIAAAANFNRLLSPWHYKLLSFKTGGFVDPRDRRLVRRQLVDAISRSNRVVDWELELDWDIRSDWSIGRLTAGCRGYGKQLDQALASLSEVQGYSLDEYAADVPDLAAAYASPAKLVRRATSLVERLKADAAKRRRYAVELSVDLEFSEASQSATALLDLGSGALRIVHLGRRD
jgi:hypothetical protein